MNFSGDEAALIRDEVEQDWANEYLIPSQGLPISIIYLSIEFIIIYYISVYVYMYIYIYIYRVCFFLEKMILVLLVSVTCITRQVLLFDFV